MFYHRSATSEGTTRVAHARQWSGGRSVALLSLLALTVAGCSPSQASEPDSVTSDAAVADSSEETPEQQDSSETDTDAEDTDTTEDTGATEAQAPALGSEDQEAQDQQEDPATDIIPPVSFEIPAIDAGSELLHLGLRDNGALEVPPHEAGAPASWYTGSPVPGEAGPAVLLGHVDHSGGSVRGVFADIPALVEGDEIIVTDDDGQDVTFLVTKAEQYGKDTFPTLEVYGNTDDAELRLITCDGYNPETGDYEDNYVVYATLAD